MATKTVKVVSDAGEIAKAIREATGNRLLKRQVVSLGQLISETAEGHIFGLGGFDFDWETSITASESHVNVRN